MSTLNEQIKARIETEPDYIAINRFDFSLQKLLARYPEGAPDRVICQALLISESELGDMWEKIIIKIRQSLGVEVDEL
jgi:hypothetical protein